MEFLHHALRPILFNIFINDLEEEMEYTFIRYMDDIKLGRTQGRVFIKRDVSRE